nr:coat protein [Apple stem pitting virus]
MASSASDPTSSAPIASANETSTPSSAPNPTVSAPTQTSAPISSAPIEPVLSQVQSVAPIVSGFDVGLHGRLSSEQMRRAQEESIRKGFEDAQRARQSSLLANQGSSAYPTITSNPFETGYAYSLPQGLSTGPQAQFAGGSSVSQPNAQRIFPVQVGVNPSVHGQNLRPHQAESGRVEVAPFSLGNRAPRTAMATSGGMRRRLDSVGLKSIKYEPQAGVVASDVRIRAIGMALIEMGIREDQLTEVGVYFARHCADVGASDKSTLLGTFPGSDITLEEVGTKIKQTEGCTLRQYCAFYAKHVWNLMLQTQSPPANWVGKEFKFETRYAAFDFFFGVESSASLEPADGLIRLPTQAERVANATSKEIQMYRIRSLEGTQAVNFGEVTGGKVGPKPVLSIRK